MTDNPRRRAEFAFALACGLCSGLSAPALATENDDGLWAIFSTTNAFHTDDRATRWHYWFDAQARYFDLGSGTNQYLVRPGIGYRIDNRLSAWAGYARLRARNRIGIVANENRYWQQLNWAAGRWNGGSLTMRTRLEQRSVNTGDDVRIVLRVMGKFVRPLGQAGGTYLTVALEPFVDLNDTDWGGDSGLAQNRASLGLGWRVSDKLTVEAGYMNQFIWVDGGENRVNHVGTLNFKVKL